MYDAERITGLDKKNLTRGPVENMKMFEDSFLRRWSFACSIFKREHYTRKLRETANLCVSKNSIMNASGSLKGIQLTCSLYSFFMYM